MEDTFRQLGDGLHEEVVASIYHAQPHCSNSRLTTLKERSAKHVKWSMENPEEPTPALILGSAVHVAILQPHLFENEFIRAGQCSSRKKDRERCTNAGKMMFEGEWFCGVHLRSDRHIVPMNAMRDSLAAAGLKYLKTSRFGSDYFLDPSNNTITRVSNHAPGAAGLARMVREGTRSIRVDLKPYGSDDPRTILTPDQYEQVMRMRDSVLEDPHARELLDAAPKREISAVWTMLNGLRCKARFDAMGGGIVADLKTTGDASAAFERNVDNFGYARQGTFYRLGCAARNIPFDTFAFIAVEKEAPYAPGIHTLSDRAMDLAADELMPLMDHYRECELSDSWPGYAPRECNLPVWAEKRIEAAASAA